MKRLSFMLPTILSLAGLTQYPFAQGEVPQSVDAQTLDASNKKVKTTRIAVLLDEGGPDDKSFNESSINGLKKIKEELGKKFEFQIFQPLGGSQADYTRQLRKMAEKKGPDSYDLILSIGAVQEKALANVSKSFPKKNFAIVDAKVEAPNIVSFLFKEEEGSYLGGVAAAKKSKTQVIGFIGGMNIPVIARFLNGFKAGILSVNPKAKVLVNYVGSSGSAWNDPVAGKQIAKTQLSQNADVIFAAAGASGLGVLDAITEVHSKNKSADFPPPYFIGVDSNQNHLRPGIVLTSVVKDVEGAVYRLSKEVFQGQFNSGVHILGIKENAVGLSFDKHNEKLFSKDIKDFLEDIKFKLTKGLVKI